MDTLSSGDFHWPTPCKGREDAKVSFSTDGGKIKKITLRDIAKLYLSTTDSFVRHFVSKYYTDEEWDDARYYIIWSYDPDGLRCFPWPVCINDDIFWNIDNIREALYHEIPEDKLFEWHDYQEDFYAQKRADERTNPINLVTRFLWEKEYTKEDREAASLRIKWIYDEITKYAEENKCEEFKAKEERRKKDMITLVRWPMTMAFSVYDIRKKIEEYDRDHILD